MSDPARTSLFRDMLKKAIACTEQCFVACIQAADNQSYVISTVAALTESIRTALANMQLPVPIQDVFLKWFCNFHEAALRLLVLVLNSTSNTRTKVLQTLLTSAIFLIQAICSQVGNLEQLDGALDGFVYKGLTCAYHPGRDGRKALVDWVSKRHCITRNVHGRLNDHSLRFEMYAWDANQSPPTQVYGSKAELGLNDHEIDFLSNGSNTSIHRASESESASIRSVIYKGETSNAPKKVILMTSVKFNAPREYLETLWNAIINNSWEFVLCFEGGYVCSCMSVPDSSVDVYTMIGMHISDIHLDAAQLLAIECTGRIQDMPLVLTVAMNSQKILAKVFRTDISNGSPLLLITYRGIGQDQLISST
jgi:hypothetical protein